MLTRATTMFIAAALACGSGSATAPADVFTYQGKVVDDGLPAEGFYNFRFELYDALIDGNQVGSTLTADDVPLSEGLLTMDLDFGPGAFDGDPRWLQIELKRNADPTFTTLSPRQPVNATPYALYAFNVANPSPFMFEGSDAVFLGGRVGIGTNLPVATLHVAPTGTGIGVLMPGLVIQENATSPTLVGGHALNNVPDTSVGVTVGGGGSAASPHDVVGNYATVGGGAGNVAGTIGTPGRYATVSGGRDNAATNEYATVGGGQDNSASERWATIGGGSGNVSSNQYTTIAGGQLNDATEAYASIGGGYNNLASAPQARVSGGQQNTARGNWSIVGGGAFNTASNAYATLGGGASNIADGDYGFVGGGSQNYVQAPYATIPGGSGNRATGSYSFAAGRQARAMHSGAFVWGDSQGGNFDSTAIDQFIVRAGGGVGINTNNPQAALHVGGTAGVDGIMFPDGSLQTSAALQGAQGPPGPQGPPGVPWTLNGADAYFTGGNVGIGLSTPLSPLHVDTTTMLGAIRGHSSATGLAAFGVRGESSGESGSGVKGVASGPYGTGVRGTASDTTDFNIGVWGDSAGESGVGIYGLGASSTGTNYGVFGRSNSPDGYAGYFDGGRNYFEGNIGIGTLDPAFALHVAQSDPAPLIFAINQDLSSSSVGVWGQTGSQTGSGVRGTALNNFGTGVGVFGECVSFDGYAGYFAGGRNYFEGDTGIGTDQPDAKLHVLEGISGATPHASAAFAIESSTNVYQHMLSPSTSERGFLFGDDVSQISGGIVFNNPGAPNGLQFRTGGNFDRVVIDATGQVGIGTSAPQALLHVNGRIQFGDTEFLQDGGSGEITANGDLRPFFDNFNDLGTPGARWDDVYATNGTIQTSDRRAKQNIRDTTYGLDALMNLRPVSFEWKDRPEQGIKLGLIAQEVLEVVPEAVRTHDVVTPPDGGPAERVELDQLGMAYTDLIPVLISAIQEQQAEIDDLRAQLERLAPGAD